MIKKNIFFAASFLTLLAFLLSFNKADSLTYGNTIATRFFPPSEYVRVVAEKNSFAYYLQNLPLKPENSLVSYYDGNKKRNDNVYKAVVDLKIGNKDLHQCADAVMRLRADYLYQQKKYDQIHFNFTNGMRVDYAKWKMGYRIKVKGNKTTWVKIKTASNSEEVFWSYLEQIFQYAGTASLEKELKKVENTDNIHIGDVFIKGGFPGHAVIVVDMAKKGNKKVFALAQSYMPAQELQVLNNPENNTIWYTTDFGETLHTPEWAFKKNQLKRFDE